MRTRKKRRFQGIVLIAGGALRRTARRASLCRTTCCDRRSVEVSVSAVDKAGNTVGFLLRDRRDTLAVRRYFEQAIERNTEAVSIAKIDVNRAALEAVIAEQETHIEIRQNRRLNNVVEQDHRPNKRIVRPLRCWLILLTYTHSWLFG